MIAEMIFVVPAFLLRLGWVYVGGNENTTLISSTAVRTTAVALTCMPRPKDRLVVHFLSSRAYNAAIVDFHVREVAAFLGLSWRAPETVERLHRVLSCKIELPTEHGWRHLRIARSYRIEPLTGYVHIEFSREFRYACEGGAICSLDVARKLASRPAVLDLYLMLETYLQSGRYREHWHPYKELRSAADKKKIMQQLRQRLELVNEAWPTNPFRWVPGTTAVACTLRRFKEIVFQRDRAEEERRLDHEIQSRNHLELQEHLATLPSWERDRIIAHYLDREYFKREMDVSRGPDIPVQKSAQDGRDTRTGDPTLETAPRAEPQAEPKTAPRAEPKSAPRAEQKTPGVPAQTASRATTRPVRKREAPRHQVNENTQQTEVPRGLFGRARAGLKEVGTRAVNLAVRISLGVMPTRGPPSR